MFLLENIYFSIIFNVSSERGLRLARSRSRSWHLVNRTFLAVENQVSSQQAHIFRLHRGYKNGGNSRAHCERPLWSDDPRMETFECDNNSHGGVKGI